MDGGSLLCVGLILSVDGSFCVADKIACDQCGTAGFAGCSDEVCQIKLKDGIEYEKHD